MKRQPAAFARSLAASHCPRSARAERSLDLDPSRAHNDATVPSPENAQETARVLIVDDDVSVTDTFSRMLRLEGYEVWAALSADEGLSLAQTHHPHAVILDLRMPLTSGLQFLRAVRAIPGLTQTPVAIVTGDYYLDDAHAAEIKALGAELRYKPLWLEELVTLARQLLKTPVQE
jgi:CheY-like chemotaxis protein